MIAQLKGYKDVLNPEQPSLYCPATSQSQQKDVECLMTRDNVTYWIKNKDTLQEKKIQEEEGWCYLLLK